MTAAFSSRWHGGENWKCHLLHRSTKATANASVFQRDAVSRFMTTLRRMSHRLSEVTKKMAPARPPPNALRINRPLSDGRISYSRDEACDQGGSGRRWAEKDRSREGESMRVHVWDGDKERDAGRQSWRWDRAKRKTRNRERLTDSQRQWQRGRV